MRHSGVTVRGDTLHVFWTRVGDAPESILHSTIDLLADWTAWQASGAEVVLAPEHAWEGATAPLEPSARSVAHGHVNQLRDPAIFDEPTGEPVSPFPAASSLRDLSVRPSALSAASPIPEQVT